MKFFNALYRSASWLGLCAALAAQAQPSTSAKDEGALVAPVAAPAFPKQSDLIEFHVSSLTTNRYFIDPTTLSIAQDGVVRYVLVVVTAGGATNISYEGMDCKEGRWKHYAAGRADASWSWARGIAEEWRAVENKPVNRHHAALSRDFFCPNGGSIMSADEGRKALRLGKHPDAS